jgi:hypothetical protein
MFALDGRFQSELREPDVDRLPHPALAPALRRTAAPKPISLFPRRAAGPAGLLVVILEGLPKTLQLQDQGFALRPHGVGLRLIAPAWPHIVETPGIVDRSHG